MSGFSQTLPIRDANHIISSTHGNFEEEMPLSAASSMEAKELEAQEELEALESFLASNPKELNNLLDKPFGELVEQLCNMGFDGELIRQYIVTLESFSKDVWVTSVGIDAMERFLELSPHEYCELYPEIGSQLVVTVVNSIKISEQHAQLLREAGGTGLSKKQKLGLEIGMPVGATALYFAPRLLVHHNTKKALFEFAEHSNQADNLAKGEIVKIELNNSKGVATVRDSKLGRRLDLKFNKWSDRFGFEVRASLPGLIWGKLKEKALFRAKNADKVASNVEKKVEHEELQKSTEVRESISDWDRSLKSSIEDNSSDMDNSLDNLAENEFSKYGLMGRTRFILEKNPDYRKNYMGDLEDRADNRYSSFLTKRVDERFTAKHDSFDRFEDLEEDEIKSRYSSELSQDEDILDAEFIKKESKELQKSEKAFSKEADKLEHSAEESVIAAEKDAKDIEDF